MVYRNEHNCDRDCTKLVAYVRIEGKWVKIGNFGSECSRFDSLDLQSEERDRETKEKLADIKSQLRQFKQESRVRRKTIENELNMTRSFFK